VLRVAPRSHGRVKGGDARLRATRTNPHRYSQTRMNRPPPHVHGKEGVDGSSPSEGSAKAPHVGAFSVSPTCTGSNVRWKWGRLWSFQAQNVATGAIYEAGRVPLAGPFQSQRRRFDPCAAHPYARGSLSRLCFLDSQAARFQAATLHRRLALHRHTPPLRDLRAALTATRRRQLLPARSLCRDRSADRARGRARGMARTRLRRLLLRPHSTLPQ
jgi:hypothetical protein